MDRCPPAPRNSAAPARADTAQRLIAAGKADAGCDSSACSARRPNTCGTVLSPRGTCRKYLPAAGSNKLDRLWCPSADVVCDASWRTVNIVVKVRSALKSCRWQARRHYPHASGTQPCQFKAKLVMFISTSRSIEREQRGILGDRKHLPIGLRPAPQTESVAQHDLAKIWVAALCKGSLPREQRGSKRRQQIAKCVS